MTYPSFSVGDVLTASDMNAVGLWKITSGSLSSTGTNFTNVFSSTYRNYRIIVSGLQTSASADLYVQLLSGTTPQNTGGNYFWAYRGIFDNAASADSAAGGQNLGFTGWTQIGVNNVTMGGIVFDVYEPNVAQRTFFTFNATCYNGTNFGTRVGMVEHNLTTAYDGIRFLTNGTPTMSANVAIYGYRN